MVFRDKNLYTGILIRWLHSSIFLNFLELQIWIFLEFEKTSSMELVLQNDALKFLSLLSSSF
jgi:hypothetical protein